MHTDTVFFFIALLAVCFPLHFVRKALQERAAAGDSERRRQRRRRARSGNAELFAPLLANSTEHHQHRLDAALRDADEGYNRCETCDFANFKRLTRCSLCGDRVTPLTELADRLARAASVGSSFRSSRSTAASTSRRSNKNVTFVLSPLAESTAAPAVENPLSVVADGGAEENQELPRAVYTDRQLRAIKRKEWTRKLDIKGNVFWYRDGREDIVDLRFPGFVAHFEPKRRRAAAALWTLDDVDIDSLSSSLTAPSSVTDSAGEREPALWLLSPQYSQQSGKLDAANGASSTCTSNTLEQRALELESDTLPIEIKLTDSTVVDATRFPLYCDRANPALTWKEVLRIASRSFPTKYAHFATSAAALSSSVMKKTVHLRLRRPALFEDSIAALSAIPAADIRSPLRITFAGGSSSTTDTAGSQREWFTAVGEQLFDPRHGIFRCVNAALYVNANSRHDVGEHHLAHLFAAGRFVGRALLDGHALGSHLALPLRKLMLGAPVTFPDLEFFDPELFRSLSWMIEHDVEPLGLDFSVTEPCGDVVMAVDLVRNGRCIPVSNDNKDFYLERRFMHELFERAARQLFAFLKGFFEVIPQELLMLFDPAELDLLLCGPDELDVDDWEKHAQHSAELLAHPTRRWFWEIVRELTDAQRRRLLRFATGCDRAPVAGFAALAGDNGRACRFALHSVALRADGGVGRLRALPVANRIEVPLYAHREELRAALLAVVDQEEDEEEVCVQM